MHPTKIQTSDLDLITFAAVQTGQFPDLEYDPLSNRIICGVTLEDQQTFYSDLKLQQFLCTKRRIWRAVGELRQSGGRP